MQRIGRGEVVINAIKEVLLVALVVKDRELRGIKKAAGVEAVGLNEIAPVLSSIRKIEAGRGRPKCAIGATDAASGLGDSLAGAGGGHDHQAGLAAILGRGRAADDLDGLNRVGGDLVAEDFALLVGDRLAINGK